MARLSPLGIITKWLLVPGALAAIGYFFIGPRVGDRVIPPSVKNKVQAAVGTNKPKVEEIPEDATTLDDTPPKSFKEPQVDVSVSPVQSTPPRKKPRRRRKRTTPPSTTATPPATAPPAADPGSSGGITPPPDNGGTNG